MRLFGKPAPPNPPNMMRAPSGISATAASREGTIFCFMSRSMKKNAQMLLIDCSRQAAIVQPCERKASGLAQAMQDQAKEDLLYVLGIGTWLVGSGGNVVIPAVQPIAHSQNRVDDEPRLAFDQFPLLLAFAHQFHKAVVVARHYGDELVLAFAGERIEFVEKQSEGHAMLDDVVDLRADGPLE